MSDDDPIGSAIHLRLLDLLSSWDPDGSDEANSAPLPIVAGELEALGAISATLDDEAGSLTLDLGRLLGAAVGLAYFFADRSADARGVEIHDEVVAAREHFRQDG